MITKDLLEKLYFDEGLTIEEIKKKLNNTGICYYIKKFGIKTNPAERRTKIIDVSKIYELYIDKNLKAEEVAKILNISIVTLIKNLKKYGIPIKGIRHYLIKPEKIFTQEQYDFFDGLMISDGSLVQQIKLHHDRNAKISCAFKHKEFAEYINGFLQLDGNIHKKIHKSARYKGGQNTQYGLFSQNNILFSKERKRWYPHGTKIIPEDFKFSGVSMNIFYLSDGHLLRNRAIILSTQSFVKEQIEKIIIKNLNNIGIKCWLTKNNEIYISAKSTCAFLEYIGPCPVKCYSYKWDHKCLQ